MLVSEPSGDIGVRTDLPKVAEARDRRSGTVDFRHDVGFVRLCIACPKPVIVTSKFGSTESSWSSIAANLLPPGILREATSRSRASTRNMPLADHVLALTAKLIKEL